MSNFNDLSKLLESFTKDGPSGCACGIAKDGKTLYEGYYGLADIESGKPVDSGTIFRMFSMTKVIICAAALILFERGKYLLNDPLYEYFPEYKQLNRVQTGMDGTVQIVPVKNPPLVKHAFSMAVGLPYPQGESFTAKAMAKAKDELKATHGKYNLRTEIKAMSQVPIAFEPGSHWLYGFGHELVAGMIEATSGMTVGEFLQKELFGPLGMDSTGYRFHGDLESRMASMYERSEDGKMAKINGMFDEHHQPDAIYEAGGAGLYSNVRDYLRFTQMMANGGELDGVKILGRKTIDLMRRNQLNDAQLADFTCSYLAGYGYGLGVRTLMDPAAGNCNGTAGEFGWTGYAGTWTAIDPAEGYSIVYMHQMQPNMEEYHHHRVRAVAYGCLK
jgi:CubicO group peptidase (beta-lactamase class C family)